MNRQEMRKMMSWAVKWFHGGRCILCGHEDPTYLELETHHNQYPRLRIEQPHDFAPLCYVCHPFWRFMQLHGAEFRQYMKDKGYFDRIKKTRVSLDEIKECLKEHHLTRHAEYHLQQAEEAVEWLAAMKSEQEAYEEWQRHERRAA